MTGGRKPPGLPRALARAAYGFVVVLTLEYVIPYEPFSWGYAFVKSGILAFIIFCWEIYEIQQQREQDLLREIAKPDSSPKAD